MRCRCEYFEMHLMILLTIKYSVLVNQILVPGMGGGVTGGGTRVGSGGPSPQEPGSMLMSSRAISFRTPAHFCASNTTWEPNKIPIFNNNPSFAQLCIADVYFYRPQHLLCCLVWLGHSSSCHHSSPLSERGQWHQILSPWWLSDAKHHPQTYDTLKGAQTTIRCSQFIMQIIIINNLKNVTKVLA